MKQPVLLVYLTCLILLTVMAVPVAAETSTITAISPPVGYAGTTTTVTITGTNFNESSVKVKLMMEDESNITSTISSFSSTEIVCKFTISSSKETGEWDLVVINEDDSEVVEVEGFSIRDAISLSSISPDNARTNNESVEFILEGSGLSDVSELYLYHKSYDNLSADIDDIDSDEITGTFDLTDMAEVTYKVCVMDAFGTRECDLSFEVTTDELGSIDISSSPTGASIYVDGDYAGVTPESVGELATGSHKVLLQKSGYSDWAKLVKVTSGDTTTVDADLTKVATTAPTTVPTTSPTLVPATIKPVQASGTEKALTPWPTSTTATPTTQASPLEGAVVLGAIGLGLVAVRKP
ncbi:MAG: PEGA domain-containing protein [Methanoregula sp.]|uniref:PEGA domain-containing protein n=1 Tax=Methanoregula sp. TaxID=2052170 RepID=UPI0025CC7A2C|nr:PEGA domain-containing protein [Methanoregula sp.]MCK9630026.1 PEGA domain-containing protein [Methanoregula sp.]